MRSLLLLVLIAASAAAAAQPSPHAPSLQPSANTLATLRQRLLATLLPASASALPIAAEVTHALSTLQPASGLYSDIDYTDDGASWWKTAVHLKVLSAKSDGDHTMTSNFTLSPVSSTSAHAGAGHGVPHA